jgi:pimeloyl-ACP methyl ester carboxylesterase
MKNLFYSFVIVLVVLLALFTISQLSTAQNRSEADAESKDQKGLQKPELTQTRSSDNIWTQTGVNSLGQNTLNNTDKPATTFLTQFVQQGPKLVGTGAVGTLTSRGRSVALSADGNTAIVGGLGDNSNVGAAWVWTRSAGVWTQQGPKLVGSGAVGAAQQGWSVALSADGNTAIVGGWFDNWNGQPGGHGIGAAWVWTRSGGVWTQQGTKLVGTGGAGSSTQGFSVSLSADGNTAIIGGPIDNGGAGAAWVWTRSAGVWTQQGTKLLGSGAVGAAQEGTSVSLSSDGDTAIIGGPIDNGQAGAAWVWTRIGGVWTQQGSKLVGSGAMGGAAQQGISSSLSADGNTAIVGGNQDNGYGAAWVFINPTPVVFSITPSAPVSGSSDQDIFVSGTNFKPNLTVDVSAPGGGVTTLSGEQIQNVTETSFIMRATLPAPGSWSIKVRNPDNQQSASFPFTVASGGPTPFITSINPVSPTANGADQYVIVTGDNFQNGLRVNATFPSGGIATLQGTGQIQNVTATSFRLRITLNADGPWKIRVVNPDNSQSAQYVFNVLPSGPPPTGLPTSVLSPVIGPLRVTTSNLAIADSKWEFNQHKTGSHTATGGISLSNDTFAWDANLYTPTNSNADAGKAVFATAVGQVVSYVGTQPGAGPGAVLIAHPNATAPVWFSGYLHMTNVDVIMNQVVTSSTVIGDVGRTGTSTENLHFVVYSGTNTRGNLRSFNATITERGTGTPPTVTSIAPTTVTQSDTAQFITINGTNFQTNAVVEVKQPNGQHLTINQGLTITATSITAPVRFAFSGTYEFVVINPSNGARSTVTCPQTCVSVTPAASLRTPVILIPGIMGSKLSRWNGTNATEELWPGGLTTDHRELKNNVEEPTDYREIPQRQVVATGIVRNVLLKKFYGPMIDWLIGPDGGYELNNEPYPTHATCTQTSANSNDTLFVFPYDWRNSNVTSAKDLYRFVQCIKNIRGNPPNFKVHIVAHSMGGLVARRYILDRPGAHFVDRMITLGTPWFGAPETANMLENGGSWFDLKSYVVMTPLTSKLIAPYIKGAHELIPSPVYNDIFANVTTRGIFPFGEDGWNDYDDDPNQNSRYEFGRLRGAMNRHYSNFYNAPGDTTYAFHSPTLQDDWRNDNTGVNYFHLIGSTYGTVGSVIAKDTWLLGKRFVTEETSGDGTVPTISATKRRGNIDYNPTSPSDFSYYRFSYFSGTDHTQLVSKSNTYPYIKNCLTTNQDPNNCLLIPSLRFGTQNSAEVVVEPNYRLRIDNSESVIITDSFGNTTDPLSTSLDAGLQNVKVNIYGEKNLEVGLPLDQIYRVVLKTPLTPLSITLTKSDGQTITQAIRYVDITLPPNVFALLEITPTGVADLKYDSDGNGTFDTQVNPTINVTGTPAQDIEAPQLNINETVQGGNSRIDLEAIDTGTGVQAIMYSLDGTTFQQYSTPLTLNAATTPTIYAFADDNVFNRSGLVTHNLTASNAGFTVGGPSAAFTGQAINASFNAPSGRPTDDWIGLFTIGTLNSAYVAKVYTNGLTSGNLQFIAPNQPGTYEFRYLINDGFSSVAVSSTFNVTTVNRTLFDYDADGRADLSVRRPSDDNWYVLRGTAGYMVMTFGVPGDLLAPADYDGDAKTDIAVFRPSTGQWFMFNSQSQTFTTVGWGVTGDLPVPADHDGDGRADLVVFRPSTNTWYTRFANGTFSTTVFGVSGDKPVVGDFDGDSKADIAVWRPSDGNWYILKTGFGFFVQTWGVAGDIPVPADYDGDGKTDVSVFRPSTGQWFRIRSTAGFDTIGWGQAGDQPIPADYDGDGKSDVAVFRPSNSTWYIVGSTAGQLIQNYGVAGDLPTQGAFIY